MTGIFIKKCILKDGASVLPIRLIDWRLILAIAFVFSVCGFSEAVTYNMQAATGTNLNGFTTNYGTCGDTTPTAEVIVPMNTSGTNACTAGRVTLTTAPGTSLLLVISDTTYAQDMTITGIDVTGNLRDYQEATNPGTIVGIQYQLGYVSGGVFTALGTADEARDYSTTADWTTNLSAISGIAPANSRLAIRVLKQNPNATSYRFYFTATSLVLNVTESPAGPTPGTIALSASAYSVAENLGTITITAKRTGGSAGAVGISYTTATGTASTADFTSTSGTLSWADGDTADKTFAVTIINDALIEGNEDFTVTLSSPTGGATLGSPASAPVTILDDDSPPPPAQVPVGNIPLLAAVLIGMLIYGGRKKLKEG